MRIIPLLLVAFACSSLLADTTLIHNVNGYTLDANGSLSRFAAIRFSGDTIDAVYPNSGSLPSNNDRVIDGGGSTLLPGLIDTHGHILYYGLNLMQVDLRGSRSVQEAVQRVREFRVNNPGQPWVQGFGWNQENWSVKAYPSAASLDQYFEDVPVWLTRIDGHAGWANSRALHIAGVGASTPDPEGGHIMRDDRGKPTGILVDNAIGLLTKHIPAVSEQELRNAIKTASRELARVGLTGVHDAGIGMYASGMVPVAVYKRLADAGELSIRINGMIHQQSPEFRQLLDAGPYTSNNRMLQINSVKIYSDGALGSSGAALIDDYSDSPGNRGFLLLSRNELKRTIADVMKAGFQANTHAIGDLANRTILDLYQKLIASTHTRGLRHRIEHASFVAPADLNRFAELNVIASIQPMFVPSDDEMVMSRLGNTRAAHTYAWRDLLEAGARISGGSDFPVEAPNPFYGIHAAVNRTDMENLPQGGWFPEQKLTVEEAFAAYTIDAAYAGHQESMLGTLEKGKKADFILIDRDIFAIPPENIGATEVLETWVGGRRKTKFEN